ncbi:hypothetical protein FC41_GL001054 [Lactobacillus hominis DSM 23910 = CRBIP 24.179]|nr:hypothetical protein FC41_GL001054 [Lactobacillus hominis DSM 23910 = CRBIP 24.179]
MLTNAGLDLVKRANQGKARFHLTRGASSTEDLRQFSIADLQNMTELPSIMQYSGLSNIENTIKTPDAVIGVKMNFDNKDLKHGYKVNAVGLYAMEDAEDATEFLYALSVADEPEQIPDFTNDVLFKFNLMMYVVIGRKDNVTVTVSADDVYTKNQTYSRTEIKELLDELTKDHQKILDGKADKDSVYNKTEVDNKLDTKANKSDVYTKTEVDTKLDSKADKSDLQALNIDQYAKKADVQSAYHKDVPASLTELNNLTEEGLWSFRANFNDAQWNAVANKPPTDRYALYKVSKIQDDLFQICYPTGSVQIYYRMASGGGKSWSAWQSLVNNSTYSDTEIDKKIDAAGKVKKVAGVDPDNSGNVPINVNVVTGYNVDSQQATQTTKSVTQPVYIDKSAFQTIAERIKQNSTTVQTLQQVRDAIVTQTNPNDMKTSGHYFYTGNSQLPFAGWGFLDVVKTPDTTRVRQIATPDGYNTQYIRGIGPTGTWTNWVNIKQPSWSDITNKPKYRYSLYNGNIHFNSSSGNFEWFTKNYTSNEVSDSGTMAIDLDDDAALQETATALNNVKNRAYSSLPLAGGSMNLYSTINWNGGGINDRSGNLGGLTWSGGTDSARIYGDQNGNDNLDLAIDLGDDNSNHVSFRWNSAEKAAIRSDGHYTGSVDWSNVWGRPDVATQQQIKDHQNQINAINSRLNELGFHVFNTEAESLAASKQHPGWVCIP